MAMSKIERMVAAARMVEAAEHQIAFERGRQARAHNRPKTGVLVPKLDEACLDQWIAGWEAADEALSD